VGIQSLFIHPVDDYDAVVQLEPSVLPRYFQNIAADPGVWARKGKHANLEQQNDDAPVCRPGFDPAQMFMDDLQATPSVRVKRHFRG
jgi:U3 small nucleolar RNA-associated protein 22